MIEDPFARDAAVVADFRASGGHPGGHAEGLPVLLLTTIGARSGEPRVAPLVYSPDLTRYVIVASNSGEARNPSWLYNLRANPSVTVEVGTERFSAHASEITGAARAAWFTKIAEAFPFYAEYARMTSRNIPVVVLERATADAGG